MRSWLVQEKMSVLQYMHLDSSHAMYCRLIILQVLIFAGILCYLLHCSSLCLQV